MKKTLIGIAVIFGMIGISRAEVYDVSIDTITFQSQSEEYVKIYENLDTPQGLTPITRVAKKSTELTFWTNKLNEQQNILNNMDANYVNSRNEQVEKINAIQLKIDKVNNAQ